MIILQIALGIIIGGVVLTLILGALSNAAQRSANKWDN